MKTMLLLHKLNKYFFLLTFLVSFGLTAAETKWEVAIVFRGDTEDAQFQKDVDVNILELARLNPKAELKIGIYRELNGIHYSYIPTRNSKVALTLGDILYRQDLNQIKISGTYKKSNDLDMTSFLKGFYSDPAAKKALVVYSHGKGADGFRGLTTTEFKSTLESIPHLDLLWIDACFMSNMEFLFEIKSFSDFTISSEEAEFASGLPFQDLALLNLSPNGKVAALNLAKGFIESYSYLKQGRQRQYVTNSAATISVIENSKLQNLALELKWVSSLKLKPKKSLAKKAAMDDASLVDLGLYLIELRKINTDQAADLRLTKIIRLLNIEAVKKLKTNPRIHIENPAGAGVESHMVYAFNNWDLNSPVDTVITHDGSVMGPLKKEWPYKTIKSSEIVLTPFAPGINVFNYYFLDAKGKLLGPAQSVSRTHDVVESLADSVATPLLYSAYTQAIGTKAERYTGINITMPGTTPSLDYFELEFNRLAEWLSL